MSKTLRLLILASLLATNSSVFASYISYTFTLRSNEQMYDAASIRPDQLLYMQGYEIEAGEMFTSVITLDKNTPAQTPIGYPEVRQYDFNYGLNSWVVNLPNKSILLSNRGDSSAGNWLAVIQGLDGTDGYTDSYYAASGDLAIMGRSLLRGPSGTGLVNQFDLPTTLDLFAFPTRFFALNVFEYGIDANFVSLDIREFEVPEPFSLLLLTSGLTTIGLTLRSRNRQGARQVDR